MAIRKYKPTTPGRRGSSVADFAEVTRDHPEKSLVRPLHGRGGRNVHGKVTARHQGGGHKRAYRLIDFRRADKDGVPAKVAHIEYDPNRTSRIALLHHNMPGVLASVNQLLAEQRANVTAQYLSTRGEQGYVVTDVETPLSESALTGLRDAASTIWLRTHHA